METRKLLILVILAAAVLALAGGGGPAWGQLAWTQPIPNPNVDYDLGNYAYSPILRKFVDPLPVVGTDIPIATTGTPINGDPTYYIGLKDFTWQFHTDLPSTKIRGYYQTDAGGNTVLAQSYLGPIIVAQRGTPIRLKFFNKLPTSGQLGSKSFIPLDPTYMGAGTYSGVPMPWGTTVSGTFTENRASLHLHGGNTPWISDGTPHQWITPAGDPTNYPKGLSSKHLSDMAESVKPVTEANAKDGIATLYYTNDQSARFMWYHDHAYGITRLNVYAGEVAGYLLTDAQESALITGGIIPTGGGEFGPTNPLSYGMPLIIQDKTFVNENNSLPAGYPDPDYNTKFNTSVIDPLWNTSGTFWGGNGSLWFPHVYMPNQLPADGSLTSVGRWDYGPWFWPPISVQQPTLPTISGVPEGFMDTPVINGKAYPVMQVDRKAYRFRILNGSNDRTWNLQLYYANNDGPIGKAGSATYDQYASEHPVLDDVNQGPNDAYMITNNSDVIMVPADGRTYDVTLPGDSTPTAVRVPHDGRFGGVPDPRQAGPAIYQIGNEGGLLPKVAVLNHPPAAVDYDYDPKSATFGFIRDFVGQGYDQVGYTLLLGPAERADVIIDFSQVPAGSQIILYNDAPAAFPLFDRRYDLYTGNPDFSGRASEGGSGGAFTTQPGFGPNTRTIMKFEVGSGTGPGINPALTDSTVLLDAFKASHDPNTYPGEEPYLVATPETNAAGLTNDSTPAVITNRFGVLTGQIPTIGDSQNQYPVFLKTITEDFSADYGRMNAFLGTERTSLDPAGQNAFGYKYIDPITEDMPDYRTKPADPNATQVWVVIHNGIDTHALHMHLWNAQVISRLGWDNTQRPPDPNELGWKETVRVNALETTIIAVRPKSQTLKFGLPKSIRPLDLTQPIGSTLEFTNPGPNGLPTVNALFDFDNEYVWHCHLLGHEENDMMRAIAVRVTTALPAAPTGLSVVGGTINWTDPTPAADPATVGNGQNEVYFEVQRSTNQNFKQNLVTLKAPANAISIADVAANGGKNAKYYYQVRAVNASGTGPWSTVVQGTPPVAVAAIKKK